MNIDFTRSLQIEGTTFVFLCRENAEKKKSPSITIQSKQPTSK